MHVVEGVVNPNNYAVYAILLLKGHSLFGFPEAIGVTD